jgi:hypothetical protein
VTDIYVTDIGDLWVISDLVAGQYVTVVQAGDDIAIPLDTAAATAYATAVMTAVEYARYDAAILAQIVALEGDLDLYKASLAELDQSRSAPGAAYLVARLRKARPPVNHQATAPLRFEPIVALSTRDPEINIMVRDQHVTSLTTYGAAAHAMHVLQVASAIGLDRQYRNLLTAHLNVSDLTARRMVDGLRDFRRPEWDLPAPPEQDTSR